MFCFRKISHEPLTASVKLPQHERPRAFMYTYASPFLPSSEYVLPLPFRLLSLNKALIVYALVSLSPFVDWTKPLVGAILHIT